MSARAPRRHAARWVALGLGAAALSACNDAGRSGNMRAWQPIPSETIALMGEKGMDKQAPTLIRAYKKEAELEIWKMKSDGKYALLKTYPMCRWSGQLGPKTREGDRQVPEGFYTITPGQMNPNSNYYLSFNVGYPNAYDRAHGYGGGSIMVHGACSSAGCFSMTDKQIAEIYAIARESFGAGQRAIQMQSLPFRMTAENLAKHRLDPNMPFWRQLKKGSDIFDVARQEPAVGVCAGQYAFGTRAGAGCAPAAEPQVQTEVAEKDRRDAQRVAQLAGDGVKPIKLLYADGGQHPEFAGLQHADISRPDALAQAPSEIELKDPHAPKSKLVQVAGAQAAAKAMTRSAPGASTAGLERPGEKTGDGLDATASMPAAAEGKSAAVSRVAKTAPDMALQTHAKSDSQNPIKSGIRSAATARDRADEREGKSAIDSVAKSDGVTESKGEDKASPSFARSMLNRLTGEKTAPVAAPPPVLEPVVKPKAAAALAR